jgi:hypothetical protein
MSDLSSIIGTLSNTGLESYAVAEGVPLSVGAGGVSVGSSTAAITGAGGALGGSSGLLLIVILVVVVVLLVK